MKPYRLGLPCLASLIAASTIATASGPQPTTWPARTRASRRLERVLDIADYVRSWIEFPAVNLPDFEPPADPNAISPGMIADFARETRRHWGLGPGPISNVVLLMENHVVTVSRYGLGASELDAFSEWVDGSTPYVVLNSEKSSAARSRFDAGHELGHLILHRNVEKKYLNKPDYFDEIGLQAHRFAGEFLLPEDSFAAEFYSPSLDAFASLQTKWKVSIAFMINRFANLKMITEEQKTTLFRNRTRRGWRTREPFDDRLEAEMPRLLRRSIEMLIDKGVVAPDQMAFDLFYPVKEIETLACLKSGYLESRASQGFGGPETIRFPGVG